MQQTKTRDRYNAAQGARLLAEEGPATALAKVQALSPDLQAKKREVDAILGYLTGLAYGDVETFLAQRSSAFGLVEFDDQDEWFEVADDEVFAHTYDSWWLNQRLEDVNRAALNPGAFVARHSKEGVGPVIERVASLMDEIHTELNKDDPEVALYMRPYERPVVGRRVGGEWVERPASDARFVIGAVADGLGTGDEFLQQLLDILPAVLMRDLPDVTAEEIERIAVNSSGLVMKASNLDDLQIDAFRLSLLTSFDSPGDLSDRLQTIDDRYLRYDEASNSVQWVMAPKAMAIPFNPQSEKAEMLRTGVIGDIETAPGFVTDGACVGRLRTKRGEISAVERLWQRMTEMQRDRWYDLLPTAQTHVQIVDDEFERVTIKGFGPNVIVRVLPAADDTIHIECDDEDFAGAQVMIQGDRCVIAPVKDSAGVQILTVRVPRNVVVDLVNNGHVQAEDIDLLTARVPTDSTLRASTAGAAEIFAAPRSEVLLMASSTATDIDIEAHGLGSNAAVVGVIADRTWSSDEFGSGRPGPAASVVVGGPAARNVVSVRSRRYDMQPGEKWQADEAVESRVGHDWSELSKLPAPLLRLLNQDMRMPNHTDAHLGIDQADVDRQIAALELAFDGGSAILEMPTELDKRSSQDLAGVGWSL